MFFPHSPGWCGSVDWAPDCTLKGHGFDSWSRAHAWVAGQVPRRSAREATTHWCFSLSPSLSLSLEMDKKKNVFFHRSKQFWTCRFWCLLVLLPFFVSPLPHGKMFPWRTFFIWGNKRTVTWGKVGWIGRVGKWGSCCFWLKTEHSAPCGQVCS